MESKRPAGPIVDLGIPGCGRIASVGMQTGRVGLGVIWNGAGMRCANGSQKWRKPQSQMGMLSPQCGAEGMVSSQVPSKA